MGLNVLVAALNKYGFGKYSYGNANVKGKVDCNHLVMGALKDAGYIIPLFATNHGWTNPKTGKTGVWPIFTQSDGKFTDFSKQNFEEVPVGGYQPGDIVVYRNVNGGSGHMGSFAVTMPLAIRCFMGRNSVRGRHS